MKVIGPIICLALIVAVLFVVHTQDAIEAGLPPREVYASLADAREHADAYAAAHAGARVLPVVGTGSMAPYIPPAPAGLDPRTTIVAYIVTKPATYADVAVSKLCLYAPKWAAGAIVMHQAAAPLGDEWIMSGIHNERYERGDQRMSARIFVGIADRVFVVQ